METGDVVVVFVTTADAEEAGRVSQALLDERAAACTNVVPRILSLFRWEGSVESENESLLVVKTTRQALPEVTRIVLAHHSYDVPEVIPLPVVAGSRDYLNRVQENVA